MLMTDELKKELSYKYDIDIFYCVTDFNKKLFELILLVPHFGFYNSSFKP